MTRAIEDFDAIREALRVIRGVIEIAGPAGNPTQPTGAQNPSDLPLGECAECQSHSTPCTGACACYC